ncbi:UDP-N-acetylglucosamine 4,6-dehydratase (inverting) [Vibrio vulnificus]|uniref:UDP-N-acetylglucosamine 4,6-dehydratase (inverting) n=1 Tax=Vibrio vulnificus TaxID=672 RepID=UPI0002F0E8AA|nr:UDP-N-acetylglucosamine 4,6-dehydratase (inverting) [Vibrio vulnificus]ASM96135.1 UDP-N-acetylglucosamine 4,6-dehydratase (inverting) [Vibrio vulnificus NBRC 15645 = ATCC 27562]ELF6474095.1 UDP-N-acetylglucosamine 4,6-dehydratase (inverting) [Vibrio vulnificus]MCL7020319.1 UDP-N-acetylglucosamine 4,6-dehydratase (inverting) [Vibrio vulnificus]MDK2702070.1 UDP-N-acetylglucosamine 4,6-dehydratase (inverting) [Vibrio vulnificus]QET75134.1 UDP-N-acetylglucosamine 4,6-dehydratase (inverting) [Vi
MLNKKTVLITGGTGSFGKQFIKTILERYPEVKTIRIYSRDELKQFELKQEYSGNQKLRFFIGDVRDRNRMIQACEGVDVIIHAAAIKQVDTAEYNPTECIRTNIDGAENVIQAALQCGVHDVVALSTDKACAPINLYGATKLASDKLFTAANNIKGSKDIRFSVVRYGNVMGSRGSVIPFFLNKRSDGVLPITHEEMTRFNISLQDGVNMVMYALEHHLGGEIFVPKIPSYKILDIAAAIAPECKTEVVGIRPGEKLHEEMITDTDSLNTIDLGKYYAILPSVSFTYTEQEYIEHHKAEKVPFGFKYNSGTNTEWESIESLRELIKEHVDPNFTV